MAYYVNHTSGINQAGRGGKTLPYKTLQYAHDQAANGAVIFLQEDITISALHTVSKSVTITSDKDAAPFYVVYRGIVGYLFTVTGSGHLTLQNINFDGNKSIYAGDNRSILTISEADSTAAITIKDGTAIYNAHTVNGAAVMLLMSGTLNMEGGIIKDNTAETGSAAITAVGNAVVNFFGGEITNNKSGKNSFTGLGSILVSDAAVNIGGDIKIYGNFKGHLSTNEPHNLNIGAKLLKVTKDFSGEVNVYSSNYTYNAVLAE